MGEKVEVIPKFPQVHLLLITPSVTVSTKDAYESLSKKLWYMKDKKRINYTEQMTRSLKKREINKIAENLFNDFELVIEPKYPIIKEIKQSLLAMGAQGALMSGSGSTVFGVFKSRANAEKAKNILRKHYSPDFFISLS